MNEEFKEKLRRYGEGTLSDAERDEVEQELEKMEAYQAYLEEIMGTEQTEQEYTDNRKARAFRKSKFLKSNWEKKIIRRGKWKARMMNVWMVLSIFLIFAVVSSIITGVFYATGNRGATYRDVTASAFAVSRPNNTVLLNSKGNIFFTMDLTSKVLKSIGDEQVAIGDFTMSMFMGWGRISRLSWMDANSGSGAIFYYPLGKQSSGGHTESSGWDRLEKLPEGTVAETSLSFDQFFTTDELLQKFEHRNLQPLWFAADTGTSPHGDVITTPLGFPYQPIWHDDDMTVQNVTKQKRGLFSSVVSSSSVSPSVESYGDGDLRNENFMKTLYMLQEHKSITSQVAPFIKLDESIRYLEQNGVKLYGAVITGPVKELLKLKEETWISNLRVGEVRLWNWRDRESS